ncbi:MAG: hypothetical protein RLO51_02870 [Thalassobaculum sp.]|uniref:hypothetical protein n=1 Tax=Thalassobaculum sp. TaxID=2022740 RepID=UPI0032ECC03F
MFGRSDKNNEKAEAEARRVEAMKASIEGALTHLKSHAEAGNTDRCEAAAKRLVESLKNPKLPTDYSRQARGVLDSLLLHGFMKATALAAKGALDAAKTDDIELRSKKIKEAREKLAGAMKYKAPAEFKGQCERLLEVAMLSGGVKQKGPTKAKPLDTTPKVENRAKMSGEALAAQDQAKAEQAKAAAAAAAAPKSRVPG